GGITSEFFDRRVNVEQPALQIERENDIGRVLSDEPQFPLRFSQDQLRVLALSYVRFRTLEEQESSLLITGRMHVYTNPERAAIFAKTFRFKSFDGSKFGHQPPEFSQCFQPD